MSTAIKPPVPSSRLPQVFRLLVVSREAAVVRSLASCGENGRWQVEIASSGWDAMERLESGGAPQLLLLDLPRGDGDGFHMLRWLRRLSPELAVVAICEAGDVLVRQEAARLGAERIVSRPLDPEQLRLLLCSYGDGADMEAAEEPGKSAEPVEADAFYVTASPAMRKLQAQAELLAQSDVPVLLVGERGSGKSAVARLIHKLSLRSGFPFLTMNCAALPEYLLEEQLFGSDRFFGDAAGDQASTIFLEEIAAMPARLQVRLLEALQGLDAGKNFGLRTGHAEQTNAASIRILSATSEPLECALAEHKLGEDLYHRLSAFTLQVPALRQRREEIPTLLGYTMRKLCGYYGLAEREFSPALLDACRQHDWPGNFAELEAFVKRYLVAGDEEFFSRGTAMFAATAGPAGSNTNSRVPVHANNIGNDHHNGRGAHTRASHGNGESHSPGGLEPEPIVAGGETALAAPPSLKSMIQDIKSEAEQKAIGAALERTGWNRKAAARLLRVSYRTLLYKIEQYQMKAPEPFFSAAPMEAAAAAAADENARKRDGKAS